MTRYGQAVEGLDVARRSGMVRVRDGHTTWICYDAAWDAARARLEEQDVDPEDEGGGEAYGAMCSAVAGTLIVGDGKDRGTEDERRILARRAVREGLLDADEYLATRYAYASR